MVNPFPGRYHVTVVLKVWFQNSLYRIVAWALAVKLLSGECHTTSLKEKCLSLTAFLRHEGPFINEKSTLVKVKLVGKLLPSGRRAGTIIMRKVNVLNAIETRPQGRQESRYWTTWPWMNQRLTSSSQHCTCHDHFNGLVRDCGSISSVYIYD